MAFSLLAGGEFQLYLNSLITLLFLHYCFLTVFHSHDMCCYKITDPQPTL